MSGCLEIKDVTAGYGAISVLHGISLSVGKGEIVSLIGANGAGKTTLLSTISSIVKTRSGSINFDGSELSKIPTHKHVGMGLAHVPEGRHIFAKMTVYENLQMGGRTLDHGAFNDAIEGMYEMFPILKKRTSQLGGTLSGGEQQMLAIARALMTKPRLLMLDEPSLGLAPQISRQIFQLVRRVNRDYGMSILLVEQNAYQALRLCSRAYVLVNGLVTITGSGDELLADERVKSQYLAG